MGKVIKVDFSKKPIDKVIAPGVEPMRVDWSEEEAYAIGYMRCIFTDQIDVNKGLKCRITFEPPEGTHLTEATVVKLEALTLEIGERITEAYAQMIFPSMEE